LDQNLNGNNNMEHQTNPVLENNFCYHAPEGKQVEKYEKLRRAAKDLAYLFTELVPPGREQSVALTQLETAVFWANAGIARNPISAE
jgi:hypothetical protein